MTITMLLFLLTGGERRQRAKGERGTKEREEEQTKGSSVNSTLSREEQRGEELLFLTEFRGHRQTHRQRVGSV